MQFRKWSFFLQLAAGSLPDSICTETERVLKTLTTSKSRDLSAPAFKAPCLVFDKKAGDSPPLLTTLPSKEIEDIASAITKSIHLWVTHFHFRRFFIPSLKH